MQKRIFGLENEFGIIFTADGRETLPGGRAVRYLFERLITREGFLNVFLENGARLYQDTGCHPEYATPECTSPLDLVKYDKAGERILEILLHSAERRARNEGFTGSMAIFKNNTDFVGNSYGCHENYLVERDVAFYHLAERLIPFFVTRQVYSGSGKVFRGVHGAEFCISQRAQHICQKISGATTNNRSIINTRDEPHADKERYRRLHVIVGDSNMSEVSTYLKVGTTAVVLEMIEDNYLYKDLTLRNPVQAIKDVSRDVTCREKVALEDGRKLTAVEVQKEYLELALKYYAERGGGDEVTADVLRKWEYVLGKLEEEPLELDREVDWVIKRKLLEAYRAKHGLRWDDHRILMMDLQYHDIRRDKGVYNLLAQRGQVARVVTDEEIDEGMTTPPQDTRAKLRGEFVRLANQRRIPYDLDWSYFRVGSFLNGLVICDDPFQTENPRVAELMQKIRRVSVHYEGFSSQDHDVLARLLNIIG